MIVNERRRETTIETARHERGARAIWREKNDSHGPRRSDREFEGSGCSPRGAWARLRARQGKGDDMSGPMSWLQGTCGQRRIRRCQPSALVETLEPRALLTTVTVHVVNFAFTPDPVTIHVGDTVHWVWDTPNHSTTSVVGSAESWDSGIHGVGFTFDHTFTYADTFVYYCVVHG